MVVAAGALEALGEEHIGRRLGQIVENLPPLPLDIPLVPLIDPVPQEHRGDDRIAVARVDLVAGQLLHHEAVIRLVGVQ